MFSSFRSRSYLLKIWYNKLGIFHFGTEYALVSEELAFSNSRLILADFINAEAALRDMIGQFETFSPFSRSIHIAVKIMEDVEHGLSQIEIQSIIDLCAHSKASKIVVFGYEFKGSKEEILYLLKNSKEEYIN